MNANQIINMIIRQLTRRAVNKGINVGMEKASRIGGKAKQSAQPVSEYHDPKQERQAYQPEPTTTGNVKHVQKMARNMRG